MSRDRSVKPIDRANITEVPDRPVVDSRPAPSAKATPPSKAASVARPTTTQLRELRAGKIRPHETIDLHGFRRDAAHRRLCNAVARAVSNGRRCVLVIHGKGHRSEGGEAILRDALTDWLQKPPLIEQVIGSSRAVPRDGGSGASYLLLHKPRD